MTEQVREIAIEDLVVSEFNPRKDAGNLAELAASIRERGVLEPILVTPVAGNGRFAIVAGSRRFAASKLAGKTSVPAIVREMSDDEAEAASLIENLHREDLDPLDEASGYARWLQIMGKSGRPATHDDLAKAVGKARSTVTNTLRLLKAPAKVQQGLKSGDLSPAHVRVLLKVADPSLLDKVAVWSGATVEDLEEEVEAANREWELTGADAEAAAKALLAKTRAENPNTDITWRPDSDGGSQNIAVPLEKWFGKPPKPIVDFTIAEAIKKHDVACECRAFAIRAEIVRKGIGRAATEVVEFRAVRVCIDKAGNRKYEKARYGGTPGHSIAGAKPKPKKVTAASREKAAAKKLKEATTAGERVLNGRGRFMDYSAKIDPKLIKGGLEREPARLVLFAIASKFSSEYVPGWRAALWRKIEKLPLSEVKKRAANWTVWAAISEIDTRRDEKQELRELVLGHYGIAVKAPVKAKKRARR